MIVLKKIRIQKIINKLLSRGNKTSLKKTIYVDILCQQLNSEQSLLLMNHGSSLEKHIMECLTKSFSNVIEFIDLNSICSIDHKNLVIMISIFCRSNSKHIDREELIKRLLPFEFSEEGYFIENFVEFPESTMYSDYMIVHKEDIVYEDLSFVFSDSTSNISTTEKDILSFAKDHILFKDESDSYSFKVLNQLSKKHFLIQKIMSDNNKTLEERQQSLELNSYVLLRNTLSLRHKILTPICTLLLEQIEDVIRVDKVKDYRLESSYRRTYEFLSKKVASDETKYIRYLPDFKSQTCAALSSRVHVKAIYNPRAEEFYSLFKFVLLKKSLQIFKQDFGLLVLHCFSKKLFDRLEKLVDSSVQNYHHISPWQLLLEKDNLNLFMFKKTEFKENLAKDVLKEIILFYKVEIIPKLRDQKNAIVSEYKEFVQNTLIENKLIYKKILNTKVEILKGVEVDLDDALQIDKLLDEKNPTVLNFTEKERFYFSDIVFSFIQSLGIFNNETYTQYGENYSTTSIISLKNIFLKDFFETQIAVARYPSSIQPQDWRLTSDSNSANFGGFLINRYKVFPGVKLWGVKSYAYLSKNSLNALNYLQSISFTINKDFLSYIKNNFNAAVLNFLLSENIKLENRNSLQEILDVFELKPNLFSEEVHPLHLDDLYPFWGNIQLKASILSVKSESDYIFKIVHDKINFKKEKEFQVSLDEISKASYPTEELVRLKKTYGVVVQKVLRFIDMIATISELARWDEFYYVMDTCFRFRIYPNTGLISTQGCNLSLSFLEFTKYSEEEMFGLSDKTSFSYINSQIDEWKKMGEKNPSKSYSYQKVASGIKTTVISLDVSGSGIQILSALIGYEDGLKLTNFCQESSLEDSSKLDFYGHFINLFVKGYKSSDILFNSHFHPLEMEFRLLCLDFFDRAFLKDLLICYLYSEGHHSRINKIVDAFNLYSNIGTKLKLSSYVKENKKNLYQILHPITIFFDLVFKEIFPSVYKTKQYLSSTSFIKSSNIPQKCGILLKGGSSQESFGTAFYSITKSKEYSKITKVNGKRTQETKLIETNQFDISSAKSSIVPNFIHYLDGCVLAKTVVYCKERNIPLYTAHDSFSTHIEYEKEVKEFFFKSFVELLLQEDHNPLIFFIKSNKTIFSTEDNEFLNDLELNRKKLIKKIERHQLIMSNYILTP